MTDIQTHLDKIRSDAAECILLSSLATDGKREVFARTAEHLNALASEIEKTIAANTADKGTRGESVHVADPEDQEEAVAPDIAVTHHQRAARPRRMLTWLLVFALGSIVGIFFWANKPGKEYWSLLSSTLQSKRETLPAPQDDTKQALATLLSGEQADRKILMEQLSALTARVDNLVTALDNLKTARAEIAEQSNKAGAEEKPLSAETKPPEEKPVRGEENRTSTFESQAVEKQSDGVPPATSRPHIEPVDPIWAIQVPPKRAELEPRKLTIGPSGCTQFRSFDPVSGTYTTLDGRRRPCRQ